MGLHHLMIGTWTPPGAIFTVQFDDEALTLTMVKRTEIPLDEPISWMSFDHARKNIYGSAMKKWSSFAVSSPTSITHVASHEMTHNKSAPLDNTTTRAIFLLAASNPPYSVYCNPFYKPHADALSVFTVDPSTGSLTKAVQHCPLDKDSGIHGAVFDPKEEYIYSADLTANKLWTHKKISNETGELELVGSQHAPDELDHPRWVAMHPTGNYLYALMEAGNRLCEYTIDPSTHLPVYTRHSYPLIPPGIPGGGKGKMYRADVCAVSYSGKYLFASSRANSFELTGYVAVFKLRKCGSIEKQLHLIPTPTSGGHSNAVSPCPWSDEWLAITDDQEGWVEIYRWHEEFLHRVARCRIQEPGFGMNAIWYD
ncbi:hypothetical protein MKZ38_000465 [Zalerion maritima]|uniref:Carboxy-cis,cis-muconate cyclase n=1 Tax=Zalerion maritima TaxID=339359 RepID=A0AAD5WMP5_9PEZI|nr:hypothetical protein MKZ38_000465 [Zalerion maritima]